MPQKGDKKKPVKNLKEKRADKKDKRDSKSKYDWHIRSPTSTTGRLFFAAFDQACPYAHSHIAPESFSLNPTAGPPYALAAGSVWKQGGRVDPFNFSAGGLIMVRSER